ncbi:MULTISPECIES: cupin domain-containing protein [unclassified Spirosoma]|uniref:cupin domain-containing protein n=1 Tax=unclassified Spirosoma TaxID=2621999 RepID=UPI0009690A71|nr:MULTISPECIES: cupin domain-containing protein [unclassified Spirosoma]MBN8821816.1 cupin domain-containing protein [Spirosoma sp.]OJW80695.1 MAG: cupin [Spirosoma sp. 48-14]
MQRRTFLTSTLATPVLLVQAEPASSIIPTKPFVVKSGDARFGVHTPYRGINGNDVKISGKDTGGQLAVFEYIGHQKVGPSLHIHHDQDEMFSIIEGEYLFQVGNEQFTVKAGDTVFAPRGIPHSWIQLSDHGKQIYMVQPAGKLEDFFLKMNELTGPPTEELSQKLHKEHGMTVIGPPLTLK